MSRRGGSQKLAKQTVVHMDPRLARLIADYQERVSDAVTMLEDAGIPRPASHLEWAAMDVPQTGSLPGGFSYFKHGIGCAVDGPPWGVDFDFREDGQIDGFNADRLHRFARRRLVDYGFGSAEEIESAVQDAHNAGDLVFSNNYYVSR